MLSVRNDVTIWTKQRLNLNFPFEPKLYWNSNRQKFELKILAVIYYSTETWWKLTRWESNKRVTGRWTTDASSQLLKWPSWSFSNTSLSLSPSLSLSCFFAFFLCLLLTLSLSHYLCIYVSIYMSVCRSIYLPIYSSPHRFTHMYTPTHTHTNTNRHTRHLVSIVPSGVATKPKRQRAGWDPVSCIPPIFQITSLHSHHSNHRQCQYSIPSLFTPHKRFSHFMNYSTGWSLDKLQNKQRNARVVIEQLHKRHNSLTLNE